MAQPQRLGGQAVEIKTAAEIDAMRAVGWLAADTLCGVGAFIRPGITTDQINDWVHEDTLRKGAIPAPLNYPGMFGRKYPKSVCTSVNNVVCHGIPGPYVLQEGDIVNVDVTHLFGGFHGDTSATFYVGTPSPQAIKVTEVARRALTIGIAQVRPGAFLIADVGGAIESFVESQGCSVVRDFSGHGIGRRFHDVPKVLHYSQRHTKGIALEPGMTFTIEPMVNLGSYKIDLLDDGWTAVTTDKSLSAQFEHTVLVTETGVEILTARDRVLENSELFPEYFAAEPAGPG